MTKRRCQTNMRRFMACNGRGIRGYWYQSAKAKRRYRKWERAFFRLAYTEKGQG